MNVIKKDAKSERGYDMRAQPRRRAKEENEQPLFLKKAFNMIDTCPDHLGRFNTIQSKSMTIYLASYYHLIHEIISNSPQADGQRMVTRLS
jgi:hypothetical protein